MCSLTPGAGGASCFLKQSLCDAWARQGWWWWRPWLWSIRPPWRACGARRRRNGWVSESPRRLICPLLITCALACAVVPSQPMGPPPTFPEMELPEHTELSAKDTLLLVRVQGRRSLVSPHAVSVPGRDAQSAHADPHYHVLRRVGVLATPMIASAAAWNSPSVPRCLIADLLLPEPDTFPNAQLRRHDLINNSKKSPFFIDGPKQLKGTFA